MKLCLFAAISLLGASPLSGQDFVVYGSTPGAIACAVRAAREGLDVRLVTHAEHVGGLLSSGLSTMDALYAGKRAPIYDELREAIHSHYRKTYGKDSPQHRASLPGNAKAKFEAHVVERLFNEMLAQEAMLKVIKGWYPVEVAQKDRLLSSVTFRKMGGTETMKLAAKAFADCSYEGDLAAVAKVPCRVGRESRAEFNEEHAGIIFMRPVKWPPAGVDPAYLAEYRKLNLVHYNRWYEIALPESTGAADDAVQAYNMRTVLTSDPANRVPIEKPANYDRAAVMKRMANDVNWSPRIPGTKLPNRKTYWNLPELLGAQTAYVEGDWATRQRVTREHTDFTLSLLYFFQNDESVSPLHKKWREWGLPKDEFPDNGHMPYEVYMRETRRIKGRAVFTENDARPAPRLKRAPVHADTIGITDWFLDSHACTPQKAEGTLWEGELLLNNITTPGQVPWRCLLPEEIDNLVVPVCLSASHIGWGAVRLEPAWMSYGEAAAHAVAISQFYRTTLAAVDLRYLQRELTENGFMLSFFNDVEKHTKAWWYGAVQYLGTQGYFGSYDARPLDPLTDKLADVWVTRTDELLAGIPAVSATESAQKAWLAEQSGGNPVTAAELISRLKNTEDQVTAETLREKIGISATGPITRGDACRLIDYLLGLPPL
ncbi:MAG: FAD-dependent oxidoreductase [Prosthecobacter sp.]